MRGLSVRGFPAVTGILLVVLTSASSGIIGCRGRRDAPALYGRYCADCHGAEGRGDGRFAAELEVRPTDFRRGLYKFKRTASGEPPTISDIVETLEEGSRGTGMIPQLQLSGSERVEVATLVRAMSGVPSSEPRVLTLPPKPDVVDRELGRIWYVKAGCDRCHGPRGEGDGDAVPTLEAPDGRPVHVPDLTRVPYRRGETAEAIAWSILAGRDGTPMSSFEGALTPEQLWGLAAFVEAMQSGTRPRGMMGLIGEESRAMRIDMEAFRAWRGMGPMRGMGGMRRRRSRE